MAGRLKVVKVNVDEAPAVSARYDAHSIPTLLILDMGSSLPPAGERRSPQPSP